MPTFIFTKKKTEEEKLRESLRNYFGVLEIVHDYAGAPNQGGRARKADLDYQSN